MDKKLSALGFKTEDLRVGESLGMLLTLEKKVHWFMNDVWRGCVRVEDYPTPMWGVVNMYGRCEQVKAEICTGKLLLVHCSCNHMFTPPQCPGATLTQRGG